MRKFITNRAFRLNRTYAASLSIFLIGIGVSLRVEAGTLRTQEITLEAGWNAVYLEVNPEDSSLAAVFGDSSVDVVARYLRSAAPFQYVDNPEVDVLSTAGWHVWYADSRPDHFLSTLHDMNGPATLLVHATEAATVLVTGNVIKHRSAWLPNAFSFAGVGLVPGNEPTFAQYFSASPAHQHNRFYRLVKGSWKQVLEPAATPMRAGEAFWAFTDGASNYQGPLEIKILSGEQILFTRADVEEIDLINRASHPLDVTVEHVVSGENPVPLAIQMRVVDDPENPIRFVSLTRPDGNWELEMSTFEAGEARKIPLLPRLEDMTSPAHSSLLRISTDLGTQSFFPIIAYREDLSVAP